MNLGNLTEFKGRINLAYQISNKESQQSHDLPQLQILGSGLGLVKLELKTHPSNQSPSLKKILPGLKSFYNQAV